jgi:hypothetical protein
LLNRKSGVVARRRVSTKTNVLDYFIQGLH